MEEEFYAIVQNPTLLRYVQQRRIQSIRFDEDAKAYHCDQGIRGGLTRILKSLYYPYYKRPKKKGSFRASKRRRRASSKEKGKEIDRQLMEYIRVGKEPKEPLAMAVKQYLETEMNHTIVACQLPLFVQIAEQERITQADVITMDEKQRLWMWEIKSGWNQAKAQGYFQPLRPLKVPNKEHNQWELQRYYTHCGLVESGLPLYRSHVLNVFQEDDHVAIHRRANPKWCKESVLLF